MGILKKENMKMNSVGGIWGKLLLCTATNDVPKCWVQNHFVCVLPPRNYALKITNNYLKFSFNLEWNPLHKHHSKRRGNMEKKDSHSPDRCSGGYFFDISIFPLALVIHLNTTDQVSAARLSALCWYTIARNEIQCHNQIVTQWTGNFRLINLFRKRTK